MSLVVDQEWCKCKLYSHSRHKVAPYILYIVLNSKFQALLVDGQPFWVSLNYLISESQISLHVIPKPPIFELHVILRKAHRITQNDLEHYKVKSTHIYALLKSLSPNFAPFHSMTSHFGVTGQFVTNAPTDPKWPRKLQGQQFTPVLLLSPSLNPFCSTPSPFWVADNFDTCTEWPRNDLEHYYKVKGNIYYVLPVSLSPWLSPKFQSVFALWPAVFELQGILTNAPNDP